MANRYANQGLNNDAEDLDSEEILYYGEQSNDPVYQEEYEGAIETWLENNKSWTPPPGHAA